MIKHISEIKIGQFFKAYHGTYYKRCKNFSVKIYKDGRTQRIHNIGIHYVELKA